ncbi:MAG: hypothetical protein WAT12_10545 [Candidatus Nitrotoga sp.]
MITNPNKPALDADLTRPGDPILMLVSGYLPESRRWALVPADPAGDHGTNHCPGLPLWLAVLIPNSCAFSLSRAGRRRAGDAVNTSL